MIGNLKVSQCATDSMGAIAVPADTKDKQWKSVVVEIGRTHLEDAVPVGRPTRHRRQPGRSRTTGALQARRRRDRGGHWTERPHNFDHEIAAEIARMTNKPFITAKDAYFLRALHGCFADLVRRLNTALDEADRLDYAKDELVVCIAEPEMEADEKDAAIRSLGEQIERLEDGR
jgi:hypothetical protein